MNRLAGIVLLLCAIFLAGCISAGPEKKSIVIRHVNLKFISDSLAADDPEWRTISSRMKDLMTVYNPADKSGKQKVVEDEILSLKKKTEEIKKRIYPLIERAMNEVAHSNNIDYILSLSEGVVYADSTLDLTGEVLSEARSLRIRNDSLSR